jgi:glycosyltransferase involved in cell wall biosynthesis
VFNPLALPADPASPRETPSRAYFLWLTELSPQGNHEVALGGIRRYLERLDGQLDVVVSGSCIDRFNPRTEAGAVSAYMRRVRLQLEKSKLLTDRIQWLGTLDHDEYAWILGGARALFHPSLIDGGTLAAAEAAGLGVPTLSSDYPPMRFYDQQMRLGISFFDGTDENAVASALKDAETRLPALKRRLPIPADLAQFDPAKLAPLLWEVVRQHV